MKADYYRYMCEMASDDYVVSLKELALRNYTQAEKINVHSGHPTRLALMLNFGTFQAEVQENPQLAISTVEKCM